MTYDLTIQEFARLTRYHPESVRRLCRTKRLAGAYFIGGRWRIRADAANAIRGISAPNTSTDLSLATPRR